MTRRLIMAFVLFTLCLCGTLQPAYSDDILPVCTQAGAAASTVCSAKTNQDPLTGNDGIIIKATNIVAFIAGAAAVVLLILGGLRYVTSNGDGSNVASAKNTIINALIGLVIIALARGIIGYVISKI